MSNNNNNSTSFTPAVGSFEVGKDGRLLLAHPSGGFKFTNDEEIKEQRRAVADLIGNIASNIWEGKDLVSVSLPVYIFEPRSWLERMTDGWSYIDSFLPKAVAATDPVERFKICIAFAISGLNCTCIFKKPFNPILGETYQADYENGVHIMAEQTSHHPPISHFEVVPDDKSYKIYGWAGWSASIRGNALKGQQTGPTNVSFSDGTVITWTLPYLWIKGIIWGERTMEYLGTLSMEDKKNNLKCEITFNPDPKGFLRSWFSSAPTVPSDTIRGDITSMDGKQTYGTIEGSWLGFVDFTRQGSNTKERLWDISKFRQIRPVPVENPLPSDCRFREDLVNLKEGKIEESQRWKTILEEKQRHEARLRKENSAKAAH
eukprot:GEZU01000949.1.p1 GENE.GEZU01000949.1~~GEZU01000949.1.p1  ORF type:complete len:374 (+),score=87.38 GEZU01000949.1:169-1290(+)